MLPTNSINSLVRTRPLHFNETTQGNSYDCCHRFYGAPEYPVLIDPDETSYRVVDKYRFADTTEILANTYIVDKEVGVGCSMLQADQYLQFLSSTCNIFT